MLVIFEGVDKSGKTTLLKEFLKRSNYKHIVYDRGPISQSVFADLFGRQADKDLNVVIYNLRKLKNLIVLCEADCDIIKQRLNEANESLPKELQDIERTKLYFELYTKMSGFNYLIVDTTNRTIDDCLDLIERKIEEIENDRSL